MFNNEALDERYPLLSKLSDPILAPERKIVGREKEMEQLLAAMHRPELCNALLLAEAGTGKTAVVQGVSIKDTSRLYQEVDVARMIAHAGSAEHMAAMLKGFFDEAEKFVKEEGQQLVLFMDEFHQLIQLSDAAVEAIKPVLAASGTRGIRVIAATTYAEYHKHISPNQPLVERLMRINITPPNQKVTIEILKGMAVRYNVANQLPDDHLYQLIYEYTQRYMPASSQPRKSILVLDSMVGWHRLTNEMMSKELLAKVLMESLGVNVAFSVDATKVKSELDKRVYNQELATSVVARRLQLCVADLHDKSKPTASMLFTGSTGVGKFCIDTTQVPIWTASGDVSWKVHGDLQAGDFVFGRDGAPVEVLGHFPQGLQDVYRVRTWDDRHLDVGGPHLWAVYTAEQRAQKRAGMDVTPMTLSTVEMLDHGEHREFFIPMNGAVQWPEQQLVADPYAIGTQSGGHGIPEDYKHGSIEQRWALVRGLFDADGTIEADTDRFDLSYSTFCEQLAKDLNDVLFSLGVSNTVKQCARTGGDGRVVTEYTVQAHIGNEAKAQFFSLPGKLEIAQQAADETAHCQQGEAFDMVGIKSIEKLPEQQSSSCIYVADEEHLYQAGQFVVTHNTELVKQLARVLFGDDQRHLIRFDMTEYAADSSLESFRSELTQRVWNMSHSVVLFDEIEKASPMVTRVLLQVLDDGRLSDDHGREVSFLNTYIVVTTNAGSEIYETIAQYSASDTGDGSNLQEYMKLIRTSITETQGDNRFPPELLGRIDEIVPFQPLSLTTQRKIIENKLRHLWNEVRLKHNVELLIDSKVADYLVEDKSQTDSNAGGARGAVALLTREVTTEVAAFINANPDQRQVRVDIDGALRSGDKTMLKSSAKVVVSATSMNASALRGRR